MKVGFATADWSHSIVEEDNVPAMGGSGWIRIGQYSPHLGMDHVIGVLVYHKKEQIFLAYICLQYTLSLLPLYEEY